MRYFIFLLLSGTLVPDATAQKKINRQYFINLLNAGRYNQVFDSATKLRKQVYGKSPVVDYFIAKSLCLDGYKKESGSCFSYMMKYHKLSDSASQFIKSEMTSCTAPATPARTTLSHTDYGYINNVSLPDASVSGKMGRVYDCFSGSQIINLSNMVSAEEQEARLFAINQKKAAVQKLRTFLSPAYTIDTSGRYVFVTQKAFPLDSAAGTAASLEKAYSFFMRYYGLRAPDKAITVYILRNQAALRQAAQTVHGIQLPDANIGYSNLGDLSLLGLGDETHLGTLYHELFHLMVRTDVGDIPPFLDEGLASLYAVSRWEGDKLMGDHRPWRLDELREASQSSDPLLRIPALDKLLNYSWAEFDGQETKNVCQVAVNYSLSNFVMIYLQEKNLLQAVVTAFKNRPFALTDTAVAKNAVQIFEEVVKDSVAAFSSKLNDWFRAKYSFDLYGQAQTTKQNRSLPDMLRNARMLLDETNERIFKYKDTAAYNPLDRELQALNMEAANLASASASNGPADAVRQSLPTNSIREAEVRGKIEAYEKKLRKLIFDKMPKTAN